MGCYPTRDFGSRLTSERGGRGEASRSILDGETNFDGHLPVMHLSLFDVAARFHHLKPTQILDRFVRALNSPVNGILNGSGGRAREFDEFIDVVFHAWFFLDRRRSARLQAAARDKFHIAANCIFSGCSGTDQKRECRELFPEHFRHDENENGSAKAASAEEIQQRVAGGGEHG